MLSCSAEQHVAVAFRKALVLARGEHEPPRGVVLLDRAARMRAHLHGEHVADLKLRADAEEGCGDAERVGIGQLGEIAGAHQDLDLRASVRLQLGIAEQRCGEAEMDRVEHRVGDEGEAARLRRFDGREQRIEVAGP